MTFVQFGLYSWNSCTLLQLGKEIKVPATCFDLTKLSGQDDAAQVSKAIARSWPAAHFLKALFQITHVITSYSQELFAFCIYNCLAGYFIYLNHCVLTRERTGGLMLGPFSCNSKLNRDTQLEEYSEQRQNSGFFFTITAYIWLAPPGLTVLGSVHTQQRQYPPQNTFNSIFSHVQHTQK